MALPATGCKLRQQELPVSVEVEEQRARWRTAVAGVLAKSSRRDPDDLGAEPERLLDSPTYEGFPIRALYTALDALPDDTLAALDAKRAAFIAAEAKSAASRARLAAELALLRDLMEALARHDEPLVEGLGARLRRLDDKDETDERLNIH